MTWTAKHLQNIKTCDVRAHLPMHLQRVIAMSEHTIDATAIWLFGSRATGCARPASDFDLAFRINNQKAWPKFVVELEETTESLYRYDCVDIDRIDTAFRTAILKQGILIHGKQTTPCT